MRSAFGRMVVELRVKRSMKQKEFSERMGIALAHISNLEHQRANINENILNCYADVLQCSIEEKEKMRKMALFSNDLRSEDNPESQSSVLRVMLKQFEDKITPEALAEIQRIIEKDVGESIELLRLKWKLTSTKTPHKNKFREELDVSTFVKIALMAEKVRQVILPNTQYLDIGLALETLVSKDKYFDYDIQNILPSKLKGAFACILGHIHGHTILLEERRFKSALNGVHFARHVIAHEIGHHFLHVSKLKSTGTIIALSPQNLAKNTAHIIKTNKRIQNNINSTEEVEAECFATLFLVPFTEFLKGTEPHYLAQDYGEQKDEVKRYARYLKLEYVRDIFRQELWNQGNRQHPIFGI